MNELMLQNFKDFVEAVQYIVADEYGKFLIMFLVILGAMFLDVLFGFMQAWINKDLVSGKMSKGILKKVGILLAMIFFFFLGICLPSFAGLPLIWTTFILEMTNETVSLVENLNKLGVETKIFNPILKRLKEYGEDEK